MDLDDLLSQYGVSLQDVGEQLFSFSPCQEMLVSTIVMIGSVVRDDRYWSGLPDDISSRTSMLLTVLAHLIVETSPEDLWVDHRSAVNACRDE